MKVCETCGRSFGMPIRQLSRKDWATRRWCSRACYVIRGTTTPKVRFWRHVSKGPECWLWTGAPNSAGYGMVGEGPAGADRKILAHRLAWEIHFGPIPEGMFVCHHCDTPLCVRPDHLFLGTHTDNMRDMAAKGRQRRQPFAPGRALAS